jgi:hypothetical protein
MAGDVEPPELAQLVDFAERPRVDDWSLRSALVRYAQPEPDRVSNVLDVVRRIEFALRPQGKVLESSGPDVWRMVQGPVASADGRHGPLVALLRVTLELDRVGDVLAEWARDPNRDRPNAQVDAVVAESARRLDELGVPREERVRPPRAAGERRPRK